MTSARRECFRVSETDMRLSHLLRGSVKTCLPPCHLLGNNTVFAKEIGMRVFCGQVIFRTEQLVMYLQARFPKLSICVAENTSQHYVTMQDIKTGMSNSTCDTCRTHGGCRCAYWIMHCIASQFMNHLHALAVADSFLNFDAMCDADDAREETTRETTREETTQEETTQEETTRRKRIFQDI